VSRSSRIGVLAAVATELLYGCSFAFTKDVTGRIDPFTLLGWRFVTALVAMLVLWACRVIRIRITRAMLVPLGLLALCQPLVYYVGETYGVMRTTASESGLIISAIPVAIVAAAAIGLRRRPSRWQVAGISVTLIGVIVTVVASGLSANFDPLGYLALGLAVVSYAVYATLADRYAQAASDVDKTFAMVLVGALVFGTIALARHGADHSLGALVRLPLTDRGFAIAVAYLALGSSIGAFFLQNVAIGRLGSTRYSTFIGISTVTTLVVGALALGERLGLAQLAGGVVILAGVYLANWRPGLAGRLLDQGEAGLGLGAVANVADSDLIADGGGHQQSGQDEAGGLLAPQRRDDVAGLQSGQVGRSAGGDGLDE